MSKVLLQQEKWPKIRMISFFDKVNEETKKYEYFSDDEKAHVQHMISLETIVRFLD